MNQEGNPVLPRSWDSHSDGATGDTAAASGELVASVTLDDLAARANTEHAEVLGAVRSALMHAINAGDALLQARPMVPEGEWMAWLSTNFNGSQSAGQQYMRLAFHKDHILAAGGEPMPIKRAYTYIRGLPAVDGKARKGRKPPPPRESVAEARRLREAGMTCDAIGEVFGVGGRTIRTWLDPQMRKRSNDAKRRLNVRRQAERRALQQKERDATARRAGGSVSDAYSLLRKTAQALERAANQAASRDDRAAILDALQAAHVAEDHLVRALGIQHGHGRARTLMVAKTVAV